MKKCIAILLGLSSMNALRAQTTTEANQRLDVTIGLGYTLDQEDNALSTQANALGFGAALDYYLGNNNLRFAVSPFVYMMQGEDLAGMKPYYKKRDYTLSAYNSGTYYNTGMLLGWQYRFVAHSADAMPVLYATMQYGFTAAHLPAIEAVYDTEDMEGVMLRSDAATAVGSVWKVAIGADVMKKGNTMYTVHVGVRRETADIPFITNTNESSPEMDVFRWRGLTAVLGLGFGLLME